MGFIKALRGLGQGGFSGNRGGMGGLTPPPQPGTPAPAMAGPPSDIEEITVTPQYEFPHPQMPEMPGLPVGMVPPGQGSAPVANASPMPSGAAGPGTAAASGPPQGPPQGAPMPGLAEGLSPDLIEQIINLGGLQDQHGILKEQMGDARALRSRATPKGMMAGNVYVASNPLAHVGNAWASYRGNKQEKALRAKEQALLAEALRGRQRYGRELLGGGGNDVDRFQTL